MPIAEAGFIGPNGIALSGALVNLGPTIQVLVSGVQVLPATSGIGTPPAMPVAEVVSGLIDTGAAQSCIDSALAARLSLPVIDRVTLSGSNGAHQHDVFACQVSVPSLGITQTGQFAGVHLAGGGQLHQVLLGRTFLQNVVMIYDGRREQVMLASASLFGGLPGFGFGLSPGLPPAIPSAPVVATPAGDPSAPNQPSVDGN